MEFVPITDPATLAQLATVDAATTGTLTYAGLTGIAANYASTAGLMTAKSGRAAWRGKAETITDAAPLAQQATVHAATTGTLTYAAITGIAADYASTAGVMTATATA